MKLSRNEKPLMRILLSRRIPWSAIVAVAICLGGPRSVLSVEAERILWTESRMVGFPDPPPPFEVSQVFSHLPLKKPIKVTALPGTRDLLVHTHEGAYGGPGHLLRFTPGEERSELTEFLQLDDIIYGVAFHPDFDRNGFMYVGCNGRSEAVGEICTRVLRFHVSREPPFECDPASQTTIIEWPSNGHNGGDLVFANDGMLFVSAGDGTSDSDANQTGQDLSRLPGSMLRIDVDHPSGEKMYSVPSDNPFVSQMDARPEIWAYGLRNPWRISLDSKTGELWAGINGQDLWETVQVVRKGENYGWSVTEGSHPFYPHRERGPTPIVKPTIEHPHSEARSLTGGYVYYGNEHPSLRGHYLYGDYSTGMIWAAKWDGHNVTSHFLVARTSLQIAGFGVDHDSELLIVDHGGGLYRLTASTRKQVADFPRLLSQTGVYQSTERNTVHPGLVPYSVNSPLWSDGAVKHRFIGLPGDSRIEFHAKKNWEFPEGTVLVKTFSLPCGTRADSELTRIETRLLVLQEGEWYGYSYAWNDEQTDALLVEATGRDREYRVRSEGDEFTWQTWHYPSRAECMVCHSRAQNYVLGLSVPQANLTCEIDGQEIAQLERFRQLGLFQGKESEESPSDSKIEPFEFPSPVSELPSLADPSDIAQPLESRVRSYLHANCANCHVKEGGGNSNIVLSFQSPLEKTRLINTRPTHSTFDLQDAMLVKPSSPTDSVLLHRIKLRGRGQMPPLATSVVDEESVKMITQWINSLPTEPSAARPSTQ